MLIIQKLQSTLQVMISKWKLRIHLRIRLKKHSIVHTINGYRGKRIYIVCMCRYGSMSNHSYILGTYNDLNLAIVQAEDECRQRAGKYEAVIYDSRVGIVGEKEDQEPNNTVVYDTLKNDIAGECSLKCDETGCSCTLKALHYDIPKTKIRIQGDI